MRLSDLARSIGATVATHAERAAVVDVRRAAAGERMSDLMARADASTLLVSARLHAPLLRVAELLDVPGLCVAGAQADPELVAAAEEHGKVLLLSGVPFDETCRRLREHGLPGAGAP